MLQESTTIKVARLFFRRPNEEFYLKGISRELGIAHTSVNTALEELLKNNIIRKENKKRGSRIFPIYSADFQKKEHKTLKRLDNISLIIQSGIVEEIVDIATPTSIVLFGSYEKGEDTEDSDIDIFIESAKFTFDKKKYEKILDRRIEIHQNITFKKLPEGLRSNIANGLVLYGFLEVY